MKTVMNSRWNFHIPPTRIVSLCSVLAFGLSFFLIRLDVDPSEWLHQATRPYDPWLQRVTNLGDGWTVAALLALVTGGLALARSQWWQTTGLALVAFGISLIPTHALKFVFGRPRPYLAGDSRYAGIDLSALRWFQTSADFQSFPSGHTSAVFSVAWIFLCARLPKAAKPVLAIFATLIAVSRVALAKHFFADVLAGAAVAVLSSQLFLAAAEARVLRRQR